MSDITCLTIPKELIRKAKSYGINCSGVCRAALIKEIETYENNHAQKV